MMNMLAGLKPFKTIKFNGKEYPEFQANGNAARFIMPFAQEVCKGKGLDIGCGKEDWSLPGSIPIDVEFADEWDATNLPDYKYDYIFSSHCLEHLMNWVRVLDYWTTRIRKDGILFLYLPDYSQEYWRPWNNTKHVNILKPEYLRDYLIHHDWKNINVSGVDLYNSFAVYARKC